MNVFMILIMAVMLGMYQYFTAKKSSDVTLNKEERAFEVELNCLKQFHEYGASRNEAQLTDGFINPNYTCANAEGIKMFKYCLSNKAVTPCSYGTITEHCVATTMSKENLANSLKALIFKKGMEEIKQGNILKGKQISTNNHPASNDKQTNFGLVSCISAERISQNERLANEDCKKQGKFATRNSDGTWTCTDVPELSECTAHEVSVQSTEGRENCTGPINEKYCCANTSISEHICGSDPNIRPTWNAATRFYTCTTGDDFCNKDDFNIMQVVDENNKEIGKITIPKTDISKDKFYTARYNKQTKQWECIPNAEKLISECKTFVITNKHAYVSVSNLSTINGTPVCNGASSNSASAIETCSACGTAELDELTGQWTCKYATTWSALRAKGPEYIDKLLGNSGTNTKGVDACFKGCENHINDIKSGKRNGLTWGLIWNSNSKLWECFTCDTRYIEGNGEVKSAYINDQCKKDSSESLAICKDNTAQESDCKQNSETNGTCVLRCCNDLYQKRGTDGKCYTKWCRGNVEQYNARIGKATDSECPDGLRLMYNPNLDCVYCIRPDATRVEE